MRHLFLVWAISLLVACGGGGGGSDPDNDGFICGPGEACGIFPTQDSPIEIVVNQDLLTSILIQVI